MIFKQGSISLDPGTGQTTADDHAWITQTDLFQDLSMLHLHRIQKLASRGAAAAALLLQIHNSNAP